MARPKKQKAERLSKVLPVRCTEDDYERIQEYAQIAGMSASEFIRLMALNGKIQIKQSKVDFDLLQELKRSGQNLNQLTMRFHATGQQEPVILDQVLNTHHRLLTRILESL